jgi:branched-chain amino acid transport system substrate-binding protein
MLSSWTASRSAFIALAAAASAIPASADVTIGVLVPSSGKGASYGQQQQNAINIFMDKYSDLGGAAGKLKLVIYDSRGDNADAINLTRKLIDSDQVVAASARNSAPKRNLRFRWRCAVKLR